MASHSQVTVIVTGFGPFRNYDSNPSWLAVRELSSQEQVQRVVIETYQLPVQYRQVQEIICDMHARLKPDIVIHCGVSGRPCYCLERVAHSKGYTALDNIGECSEDDENALDAYMVDEQLLNSLVEFLTQTETWPVPVCVSSDAGRFLCEYSLFQSLRNAPAERICLFLHVPASVPVEYSTKLLHHIVKYLVRTQFASR